MSALYVPETGFCGLNRLYARGIFLILICIITLGLFVGVAAPQYFPAKKGGVGDGALYTRIIDDVARGEDYHVAAVREQRTWGYTLKPVWTVREPALAVGLSLLPPAWRPVPLWLLALAVVMVWCRRVQRTFHRPVFTAWAFGMMFLATVYACADKAWLFHESWAGLLIALSLAMHDKKRWWLAVVPGLVAALIRELAVPYLCVMALAALWDNNRREAAAWGSAILLWGAAMAWHAHAVGILVLPSDPASRGWMAAGGWPYVLLLAQWNGLFAVSAPAAAAVVLPIMLMGCWAMRGYRRIGVVACGYAVGFMVFGRPDTSYWGLVVTPLWGTGAVMAPAALWGLVNAIHRRKPARAGGDDATA